MKLIILIAFLFGTLANSQITASQYTAQFFQAPIPNRPCETIIDNVVYTPPNACQNLPIEYIENIMYSALNRPIEVVENMAYPPSNIVANRPVEILENIVYPSPNVVVENNMVLPPVPQNGNTILITDCSPSACQSLSDTLQLMIVCNLLQNTERGRDFALKLAGPVINQLISSPVLSCGCPNPIFGNISPLLSEVLTSSAPFVDIVDANVVINQAPVNTCSCQTLSGTVSSCPCQACAGPVSCSCQTLASPFSLYTCQQCSSPVPTSPCQNCFAPMPISACPTCSAAVSSCPACSAAPSLCPACAVAPSCPCESCTASLVSSTPIPPPPPSCVCQACKACPNTLNAMLSSFLNFL